MDKKSFGERYKELKKEIQKCYDEIMELNTKFESARKSGKVQRKIDINNELYEVEMRRDRLQTELKKIKAAIESVS